MRSNVYLLHPNIGSRYQGMVFLHEYTLYRENRAQYCFVGRRTTPSISDLSCWAVSTNIQSCIIIRQGNFGVQCTGLCRVKPTDWLKVSRSLTDWLFIHYTDWHWQRLDNKLLTLCVHLDNLLHHRLFDQQSCSPAYFDFFKHWQSQNNDPLKF